MIYELYKFGTEIFKDEEPFCSHDNDVVVVVTSWGWKDEREHLKFPIVIDFEEGVNEASLYLYNVDEAICRSASFTVLRYCLAYCSELPDKIKKALLKKLEEREKEYPEKEYTYQAHSMRRALYRYSIEIYWGAKLVPLPPRGMKSLTYAMLQWRHLLEHPEAYKQARFYSKKFIHGLTNDQELKDIILRQNTKDKYTTEDIIRLFPELKYTAEPLWFVLFDREAFLERYKKNEIPRCEDGVPLFWEKPGDVISEWSYGIAFPWREANYKFDL